MVLPTSAAIMVLSMLYQALAPPGIYLQKKVQRVQLVQLERQERLAQLQVQLAQREQQEVQVQLVQLALKVQQDRLAVQDQQARQENKV